MSVDLFSHFCLKFGHITFILPIVVIGMIFHRRDVYAKAACCLLWVMIFNTLLKILFKVPLFPHLGPGYAFPSGHMHATTIFYGYFFYKIADKRIKIALAAVISSVGFSLVRCHFHDWIDISGAVVFSIAELFLYYIISKNFGEKVAGYLSIFSAIFVMIILAVIHKIEPHVWLAFYGLVGMEFALTFMEERIFTNKSQRIFAFLFSIAAIVVVYYLFKYLSLPSYLSEIRFALMPLIIVWSSNLSIRVIKNKNFASSLGAQ